MNALRSLGKTIKDFPIYVYGYLVGLVIAIMSDLHITTLAITGVAVGFAASSALIGVAAFFAAYSLSRIIAHIAEGFHAGLKENANAIAYHANTMKAAQENAEQSVIKVED